MRTAGGKKEEVIEKIRGATYKAVTNSSHP